MKLEFSLQIFGKKISDMKFYENKSSGSRIILRGRTDGHVEANIRFSKFCESAKEVSGGTLFHSEVSSQ